MEYVSSSSSAASHHNVEVVELDQEDLKLEHQHELERDLHNLTNSIITTSELQKQEAGKGKAILQDTEEEKEEPISPVFEPSYQALKLALSLSEGQLENKRRRMSAIDENRASGHNHGQMGHQLFTDNQGYPTLVEGMSSTPIYDELKHKELSVIGTVQPPAPVAKAITPPALNSKPLVPSPLRNEQSSDEHVLTPMPSADVEMSHTTLSPRKFFKRRAMRSDSRARAPHTRIRQDAPNLPTGAVRGESPAVVETSKPTSPISSFLTEAARRSGELRRHVSSAGGNKGARPRLTRMQRQEGKAMAQKTATQNTNVDLPAGVQDSPTAVLAAMLAVRVTATAIPATLQEESATSVIAGQEVAGVGSEAVPTIKETEVPAKAKTESSSGFFRTRSLRSKAARNVPTEDNSTQVPAKEAAPKIIPAPLGFFRKQSQQSVTKSVASGNATGSGSTRLQAWGAAYKSQKTASNTDATPAVDFVTENTESQAEAQTTKAESGSRFFKRRSMRAAPVAKEPSLSIPTENNPTVAQVEEPASKTQNEQSSSASPAPQTDAESAAKLAAASSTPLVIPTKKNPTRFQPAEQILESKPEPASTSTSTLQAFVIPTKNNPTRSQLADPVLGFQDKSGGASTPNASSIPRPISIGNPTSGAPSPSPAQNPLEPKPRTHVHFSRKRGESDCTLCAPEYLQAGTIPATIPATGPAELPPVLEAAPIPFVPMVPTIGTRAMTGAQHTSKNTAVKQAEADMRTSSFRRQTSKIPRVMRGKRIDSGYRGFGANTTSLRKQKSPSGANVGTEKELSSRRPRPVNPFRRSSRSTQPEFPMLAIALAPSPPTDAIVEEVPTTLVAELPDNSETHCSPSTTPFAQQRFFRTRSLRNTSSAAEREPSPLSARNIMAETSTDATATTINKDVKKTRTSPHKRFFRSRSRRNLSKKSPAPLRKVAQRERFSLEDPEPTRSTPRTVHGSKETKGAAGKWLRRRSLRSSAMRSNSSVAEEAVIDSPLHEFESLPRHISAPEAETRTKSQTKSRNGLRSRVVVRSKAVANFLQRGSRRNATKARESSEAPVLSAVLAPSQEVSSNLLADAGLGDSTATATTSSRSRRSRLPIPLFSKRSQRTTPRDPLRAPPALPPRNDPQVPVASTVPDTFASRAVVEDEITPVVENEKVNNNASDTVESGLQYTRAPKKLITYLIPLPMPILRTGIADEADIQQRFLIYTPPAPHLLKPAALAGERIRKRSQLKRIQREGKRHWGKRKIQEEVRKANTYNGKTVSFKGIHSKVTKGVVWAVRRIRPTDIVFLNRVNRKEVEEIHLIHPPTSSPTPQIRTDLLTQLSQTRRRAATHTIISTLLLPIALVIDTVAVVIWPFGGLFEVDAVWWYASIKGWYTSRSITKRMSTRPSRLGRYKGERKGLRLVFEDSGDASVLERYVADWCHKADPGRFPSVGVPPSEGEVERSLGWVPVVRETVNCGADWKGKGVQGATAGDEEVQRMAFREDLKAVVEKGALSWRKSCAKYDKGAMKAAKKRPSLS